MCSIKNEIGFMGPGKKGLSQSRFVGAFIVSVVQERIIVFQQRTGSGLNVLSEKWRTCSQKNEDKGDFFFKQFFVHGDDRISVGKFQTGRFAPSVSHTRHTTYHEIYLSQYFSRKNRTPPPCFAWP